jgi:flagellar biosynthesis/type III secretory pathway protein FliH
LGSTDDAELPGAIVLQPQREYADEANTKSTFAERFREEGRAQGVQQGVQQGMQRGEAAVLTRQLERKLGPVPAAARQRIEAADEETLLGWSERVLTATRLDDVFR